MKEQEEGMNNWKYLRESSGKVFVLLLMLLLFALKMPTAIKEEEWDVLLKLRARKIDVLLGIFES